MEDSFEVKRVPGKFGGTEEAILDFLYAHPDGDIGTMGLMGILKPEQSTDEEKQQAFEETQHGIETLIAARFLKGKRRATSLGDVYYEKLRLTPKGEAEAIKQKRNKISVNIIHIGGPEQK